MPDTTFVPDVIRESAPRTYAARSADRERRGLLTDKVCQGRRAELAEAADNLLRGLRVLQNAQVSRPQEMKNFLSEMVPALLDQIANVNARIDSDADDDHRWPPEPLDISELTAFWESVK